ncbi:x-pro dipeptidyl-peptidase [Pyrenophora seminiperda CCB06]|uniref:X-pro dipeptidyl-peptidase n=1 Tax=Pyrenophora seminiperda CCB06 TaxID=1302712 RepID=A0A3M7MDD1_9PLEO|nr:x-pro dipeptidyl-peptidase [Pyrenophora seminiperda CCB06]
MPNQRQSARIIAQNNARRKPNITPAERLEIIAKREQGVLIRELAEEYGRSQSTIKYTLHNYATTHTTHEKPRSGRPPILSPHQKKIIHRKVRANPEIRYKELAEEAVLVDLEGDRSKPPSQATLYRLRKRLGLSKYSREGVRGIIAKKIDDSRLHNTSKQSSSK